MTQIFKKILSVLFGMSILSLLVRILICSITWFIILPKVYHGLDSTLVKVQLFLLSLILLEILLSKLKLINLTELQSGGKIYKDSFRGNIFSKNVQTIFNKTTCHLFLHTSEVSVEKLLLNNNYTSVDLDYLKDKKIQIFDNYHSTIISCDLQDFKNIIVDENYAQFTKALIKNLKKSFCPSITVIMGVDETVNLDKNSLLKNFYSSMQYFNRKLKTRFNLNIIIDNLSKVVGYDNFLEITKEPQNILNISYLTNAYDLDNNLQKFASQFQGFLTKLDERLIYSRITEVNNYQLSYIFIEQIRAMQKSIRKLIESIAVPVSYLPFGKSLSILITIHFINSTSTNKTTLPIISNMINSLEQGKNA